MMPIAIAGRLFFRSGICVFAAWGRRDAGGMDGFQGVDKDYPLVNIQKAIENGHL